MRMIAVLRWGLPALLLAILGMLGVLYILAGRAPDSYRPMRLTAEQKRQAVADFGVRIQDFGNAAQQNDPYTWSVREDRLNEYLASLDEIAANLRGGRRGRVEAAMAKAGLAEPAVRLRDGLVTLAIRSTRHNRIFSVDLAFTFASDKSLRVRLEGAHIGDLVVPKSFVRGALAELQALLARGGRGEAAPRPDSADARRKRISPNDLANVLAAVVAAIDGRAIRAELTWPVNKRRVRIDRIDITDGLASLHVQPTGRKWRKVASRPVE